MMMFGGMISGSYVKKGCVSFAWFYHRAGISELPDGQNFLFEPNEFDGYTVTPILSGMPGVAPPKEIMRMDTQGTIRVPAALLNQLKEEKSRTVVIVGCMDNLEIYSRKAYKELRRLANVF